MKFVLIWANENWTRTWDGSEANVLLQQDYREEDEAALLKISRAISRATSYLRHRRSAVIFHLQSHAIPETRKMFLRWREPVAQRITASSRCSSWSDVRR